MNTTIIDTVRKRLTESIDAKVLATSAHFFKEGEQAKVYGVRMGEVSGIAKESWQEVKGESKPDIFQLCEQLWQSGFLEEAVVACEWAYRSRGNYEPCDIETFEHWLKSYVDNWGACDTLCNHTIGTFVEMFPEYISRLKEWAKSDNRWMRRGAAVTLIIPARKGLFLDDIVEIATTMMMDRDDMVQKGYGWMLKAASEAHCNEIFDFVTKHRSAMPRTAYRYALEKMPKDMRAEAMKK